jgi:hypothetical protein
MNEPTGTAYLPPDAAGPASHRDSDSPAPPGAAASAVAAEDGNHRAHARSFLLVLFGCVTALSMLVGTGLIFAWRSGSIVVQVSEHGRDGDNVRIRVPAAAGHLALLCLPDRAFGGSARDRVFQHGEMRLLAGELERIPDGTVLVQVDSPRETVQISREHGMLLIHVDSDEEKVRVEVPVKLAGAFLKRVERVARIGC